MMFVGTICALRAGVPPSGHWVQIEKRIPIPSLRSYRRLTGVTESQPILGWLVCPVNLPWEFRVRLPMSRDNCQGDSCHARTRQLSRTNVTVVTLDGRHITTWWSSRANVTFVTNKRDGRHEGTWRSSREIDNLEGSLFEVLAKVIYRLSES